MSIKYASCDNYFSISDINDMMFTGLVVLQVDFCCDNKYRLIAYLHKDFKNPSVGCPNCVDVCLGQTRKLSKLPSKHFSNVRNYLMKNSCLLRWLGV